MDRAHIFRAKKRLVQMHYKANAGHLGGNLSCLDSLVVLFHKVMTNEDTFILSKGHSAGALYIALWSCGRLSDEELETFACDATRLGVHPPIQLMDVVPFGTGSLGHGPSLAVGMAMGKRLQGHPGRVYCLCSDGEWQEGSCWEALGSAVHFRLGDLTILVDVNGWQGFGSTQEVASVTHAELASRFESFGAVVTSCDGHCPDTLVDVLSRKKTSDHPHVILMQTCKGRGLPFFENTLASHYLSLTDEQYEQACHVLED